MISKKQKKVYTTLNYTEHLLILVSELTAFVLISAFASLVGIPVGIVSSAAGIKICTITAVIKSIIKKKEEK